jgi:hypothetical protein
MYVVISNIHNYGMIKVLRKLLDGMYILLNELKFLVAALVSLVLKALIQAFHEIKIVQYSAILCYFLL